MKIVEIEWLKENAGKLSKEELAQLKEWGLFEQIKKGELNYPTHQMMDILSYLSDLYKKYKSK